MYSHNNATKTAQESSVGPGVYHAIILLILALIFKFVTTIFTFGMKVFMVVILKGF